MNNDFITGVNRYQHLLTAHARANMAKMMTVILEMKDILFFFELNWRNSFSVNLKKWKRDKSEVHPDGSVIYLIFLCLSRPHKDYSIVKP